MEKKDRDKRYIKNRRRPVSLLNVDIKILSKAKTKCEIAGVGVLKGVKVVCNV